MLQPLAAPLPRRRPLAHLGGRRRAYRVAQPGAAPGVPVMRAMPNRPALLGAGATGAVCPAAGGCCAPRASAEAGAARGGRGGVGGDEDGARCGDGALGQRTGLFLPAGRAHGARPAPSSDSRRRARSAWRWRRSTARDSWRSRATADLARLRAEVTSTGGTTEAALAALAAADLERRGGARAAAAATSRSRELAAQLKRGSG